MNVPTVKFSWMISGRVEQERTEPVVWIKFYPRLNCATCTCYQVPTRIFNNCQIPLYTLWDTLLQTRVQCIANRYNLFSFFATSYFLSAADKRLIFGWVSCLVYHFSVIWSIQNMVLLYVIWRSILTNILFSCFLFEFEIHTR